MTLAVGRCLLVPDEVLRILICVLNRFDEKNCLKFVRHLDHGFKTLILKKDCGDMLNLGVKSLDFENIEISCFR